MDSIYQDTIVAPATIPGTGAITIIRVSGSEAFTISDAIVQLKSGTIAESKGYSSHFGKILKPDGALLDDVVVTVFRAPHSYTGEDSVELSCHASSYIAGEILKYYIDSGARMAGPGEFSRRAYLNGKMDLAQAEAVADLISAESESSHRVAIDHIRGSFSSELHALRQSLLEAASLIELELDFSEEEVEFADRRQLAELVRRTRDHAEKLASSFRDGNMIKNGVPVAIVGPVNAGKSTLLNALLGEDRAIVSPIPGTTRDTIEETINIDGLLFRFIDTAGLREGSEDTIELIGMERSVKKLKTAEIVIGVIDSTEDSTLLENQVKNLLESVDFSLQKLIIVLNKVDVLPLEAANKNVILVNNIVTSIDYKVIRLSISAKAGIGINLLKSKLKELESGLYSPSGAVLVTNYRHYQALKEAVSALDSVSLGLATSLPTDLVAEDLRRSIYSINLILGDNILDPSTVLNEIFSRHCIGK